MVHYYYFIYSAINGSFRIIKRLCALRKNHGKGIGSYCCYLEDSDTQHSKNTHYFLDRQKKEKKKKGKKQNKINHMSFVKN